ncbi:MAG: hypothetical protein KGL63_11930 [Betaproteobacteria bacterium]|nr:hypothetical protein [Betaproteobacteria bacterium]
MAIHGLERQYRERRINTAARQQSKEAMGIACVMLTNRTMFDPEKMPTDRPKSA